MELVFKIVIIGILLLTTICALFFIIFIDAKLLFWYIIDKKNIRNKVIREFTKDNQEIILLGTLHHMHYQLPEYSFQHLKAVLDNYQPDLLLVESRQEEINQGNLADGPLEMFLLHMYAKELGIPVQGIDWFSYKESKPGSTNKQRDQHIHNKILNQSQGYSKVLVAVGATHMLIETKLLIKQEYQKNSLSKEQCDALFFTTEISCNFPDNTKEYIEFRIKREEKILKSDKLTLVWQKVIQRTIGDLQKFMIKL